MYTTKRRNDMTCALPQPGSGLNGVADTETRRQSRHNYSLVRVLFAERHAIKTVQQSSPIVRQHLRVFHPLLCPVLVPA